MQFNSVFGRLLERLGLSTADAAHELVKQELLARLDNAPDATGTIVDYYLSDVENSPASTDIKVAIEYESEKYGSGEILLDPPEPETDGLSEFEEFMWSFGVDAVHQVDQIVGEEVELELVDGTLNVVWDDEDNDGVFYENLSEDGSDPLIADGSGETLGEVVEAAEAQQAVDDESDE